MLRVIISFFDLTEKYVVEMLDIQVGDQLSSDGRELRCWILTRAGPLEKKANENVEIEWVGLVIGFRGKESGKYDAVGFSLRDLVDAIVQTENTESR